MFGHFSICVSARFQQIRQYTSLKPAWYQAMDCVMSVKYIQSRKPLFGVQNNVKNLGKPLNDHWDCFEKNIPDICLYKVDTRKIIKRWMDVLCRECEECQT